MTERERLIKLLNEANQRGDIIGTADTADFLIANGVIVPPCELGTIMPVYFGEEEVVWEIRYIKSLDFNGDIRAKKEISTRRKDETPPIFSSHPMTFEEATRKLAREREERK